MFRKAKKLKLDAPVNARPALADITDRLLESMTDEEGLKKDGDSIQIDESVNWFSMPRNIKGRYGHSPSLRLSMRASQKLKPLKSRPVFKLTKLPSANHNISGCALSRRVLAKQITELFTLSEVQVQVRGEEYPDDALELAENGLMMEFSVQKFLEGHGSEKSPVKKWMGVSHFAKESFGQDLSLLLGDLKSSLKAKAQAENALIMDATDAKESNESDEDPKECETRFTEELGWIDDFADKTHGVLAKEAEERWAGNEVMQKLYAEKVYMEHGLYASLPTTETEPKAPFKFPLPIQEGELIMQTELDFALSFDLKKLKKPKVYN